MVIMIIGILITCFGMSKYKSINPFYAPFEWLHKLYWWIITKGKMALHPKDPKFKYLKLCDKVYWAIKHIKIFEWVENIDHTYGGRLRYKMKWKPLIGDTFIIPNGCPECGSDMECTSGIAVMCTNWQHPHMEDLYYKGGNRNCSYSIMAG